MQNKDMPAMPIELNGFGQFEPEAHTGLTKREMFAMYAMQNILGRYNPFESGDFDSGDYEETTKHAVGLADALLKELEK